MSLKQRILIVDDTPSNIRVLNGILKDQYHVSVATNGIAALEIANSEHSPDLILLDIMMPEMDGYEVCKRLKASKTTSKIPIIFVTAMGKIEDETKGFELGCVDYITKPISPPIVLARIGTHLELKNAKNRVDQLLSKTLLGSIKMMSDIVSMINPMVFSQSSRLKKYASQIGQDLNLPGIWRLEIATTLSQIGTILIPNHILKKVRDGKTLTVEEQQLFNTHTSIAKELISNIPSLEIIGQIIERQRENPPDTDFNTWDFVTTSSQILKLIHDYDKLIIAGRSQSDSFSILHEQKENYSKKLLAMLVELEGAKPENVSKMVYLKDLREGMVLLEDVICDSNVILVGKYTEISENILYLLLKNAKQREIREPMRVILTS